MTAPGRAVPEDRRGSPGDFQAVFESRVRGRRRGDRPRSASPGACRAAIKSADDRPRHAAAPRDPRRGLGHGVDGRGDPGPDGAPSWRPPGDRPPRSRRVLDDRKADLDLFVALDTLEYLKRGGRISGSRGGDRDPPFGQADHHRQGRRGRDGRQAPDPVEGPRAGHRAHDRAAVERVGDPPHDGRGRSRVPRRAVIQRMPGGVDPADGLGPAGRSVGRAASRPRLARRRHALRPPIEPRRRRDATGRSSSARSVNGTVGQVAMGGPAPVPPRGSGYTRRA